MIGSAPTFYTIPITEKLLKSVEGTSSFPAEQTLIQRYFPPVGPVQNKTGYIFIAWYAATKQSSDNFPVLQGISETYSKPRLKLEYTTIP